LNRKPIPPSRKIYRAKSAPPNEPGQLHDFFLNGLGLASVAESETA